MEDEGTGCETSMMEDEGTDCEICVVEDEGTDCETGGETYTEQRLLGNFFKKDDELRMFIWCFLVGVILFEKKKKFACKQRKKRSIYNEILT